MKSILIFLLITTLFQSTQKDNIHMRNEIKLKWLLSGLPEDNTAKNLIAKMYGFEFLNVGGCVI